MLCPRCHAENREGRRFCAKCAAPLATACPSCGFSNEPGEDFCGGCAAPLAVASRPVEPRFASPQSYTPKHLAEKILTSRAALEGERKQVTVLFADLKGSMELLTDRDPEEARKLLDPVLERMMEAVHRYEGTVNQVMGDGIMALFGAPVAHEDHAVRACYAALRMQESITRYAEHVRRTEAIAVHIRVGLNSGDVVVRYIGSDLHMDYTAVGQTTHLAARMEQLAQPGSTLITGHTLRLAEAYVRVRPLGPVSVKGLVEPLEVYELIGADSTRTRLQAMAARGLTRFVGRDRELDQIHQALDRAQAGHGQLVALVGEPGVGKSRVVWEVTHSHRTEGWLVLEAGSVSHGKATPYLPVIDLLKTYFKIEDRDAPREVREKVTGKLLTLDRALEPLMGPVLALLDVPVEGTGWATLDPLQRRQRTLDAIKQVLLRESQLQPVLLVFEDLHWIDSESQALLEALVESVPTARLLLLVNYRPEYQHAWGSRTSYTQFRLDPLAPENAEQLLRALLGPDAGLEPLTRVLIERTEGNPFFLEESVRTVVETGSLVGAPGAYRLARRLPAVQVPATVQAVLAARIDRLPPEDKALLQTASVVGKDVPFVLLEAVAGLSENDLERATRHLQAGELLYETQLFPNREYTFKHALTHEVAYGSLLHERRRVVHAKIMEAIERLSAERIGEPVELLAHHALRGEQWAKAARHLYAAGEKAVASARYAAAASFYSAALESIERQGDDADLSLKLDVCLELWVSQIETGEGRELVALATKAEKLAETLGDGARLAQVRLRQAQAYRAWGITVEDAIHLMTEAFDLADSGDVRTRSYALNLRGGAYRDLGRLHDAIRSFEAGCALLLTGQASTSETRGLVLPIYVTSRALHAEALGALGRFDAGEQAARDALRMATEIAHLPSIALANAMLGHVHAARGQIDLGRPLLERGLAIGVENGFIHGMVASGVYLAHALVLSGRYDEALRTLQQALDASRGGYPLLNLWTKYGALTAAVLLGAGRRAEAQVEIERALALIGRQHALGHRPSLLCLQAELVAQDEPARIADAVALWEEAAALAAGMDMRPLVAHCHLGLGKLYRRTGNGAKAEEHLTTARAMYREMGMGFWLAQAEAATAGGDP